MAYIKCFPISTQCTLDDVEEVFERFGEIQQTLFSTDFGAQRVALVEFVSRRSADRALEFDGERIGGVEEEDRRKFFFFFFTFLLL